ncbi:uncharacterized protein B0H18DRAFT_1120608 [Fomitopsis serialis]|uniref:uncharacterized protein n=1 Tax=Fomitopsis serialis TaxID=139415 RepID=UPI0020074A8A|nr:uncharacterized protein B0H18DRAFT_1120608 [Neoantrodia serialis]KAH9923085.1 hypothetical protein B0H18DRAFT_1120608 [Neoantrodia serialis]
MASFGGLFNPSVLPVVAPGSALEFPDGVSCKKTKDWISRLYAEPTGGRVAFLGEAHRPNRRRLHGDRPLSRRQDDDGDLLSGLEEINFSEGLQVDSTFANSENAPLRLPSARLGPKTRRTAFALPPVPGPSSSKQSGTLLTAFAFAKTRLPPPPASGFHVRMRTIFVPYFLLQRDGQEKRKIINTTTAGTADECDGDDVDVETREQRKAGNEGHAVVLAV